MHTWSFVIERLILLFFTMEPTPICQENEKKMVIDEIRTKLDHSFTPSQLEIEDQSEQHRGHGGWREGGQTHFHVVLRAPEFTGLSRIARHRLVHTSLGKDLVTQIHALSLDLNV